MQWIKQQGMETRILSDCNTTFISHMLSAARADPFISAVYTNPAVFTRIDLQVSHKLAIIYGHIWAGITLPC